MPKISALPSMTSPDTADPAPVVDDSATTTKKLTLGGLRDWLYSLVNIPTGPASPVTRDSEHFFDHVASGLVITGDAYASTRNASMTAGVCYINGRRISLTAVAARTYTASRDTYVDVLDNLDGTGTLVYTEVTNNAASPALAANSIRIGIVVTGASNIANVGAINQGQPDKVLPIASSTAYTTVDSLGNMICSRDPNRRILAHRQTLTSFNSSSASGTAITGMSTPIIAPANRTLRITATPYCNTAASGQYAELRIFTGASLNALTTQVGASQFGFITGSAQYSKPSAKITPAAGLLFVTLALMSSSGTATVYGGTTAPTQIEVEIV